MMKMDIDEEYSKVKSWIEENSLAKALLKKSSLNKKELMALMIYFRGEDISFSDLASKMDINRSGAWKRWKKGYKKIIQSFFTVELAVYGGILDLEATKLLTEDLKDYLKLSHEQGDLEAIRSRLERRMAEMDKKDMK